MRRVTPQPSFGHDLSASLLDRFREYSVALNQCADHRLSEFVSVTGTYTAGQNDHVIECAPSGAMTVTLPAASVMRNKRIVIKRTNNTTHVVTIQSSSGNIDGAASVTLTTAHQSREVFSDGANWWLLDTGATAPTDPYWANVVLMLHMDATFADSSTYNRTPTVVGDAAISTSIKQFDAGSGTFDGTGDKVTFPNSDDFKFTGDFTIEFWVRSTVSGVNGVIFSLWDSSLATAYWLRWNSSNRVGWTQSGLGGSEPVTTAVLEIDTWNHVAVCRSGSTIRIYGNGVDSGGTYTTASTLGSASYTPTVGSGAFAFTGQIDDLRITNGVARYTADFDVPTSAFPDS